VTVKQMDHVGFVVDDLEAAVEFFAAIGLEESGRGEVEGELVDRIVALDGVHTQIVFMQVPDGAGRLELVRFLSPPAEGDSAGTPSNVLGLRHVSFAVDDIDAAVAAVRALGVELIGELVNYKDFYRLCYVRGPAGIIVELAEPVG